MVTWTDTNFKLEDYDAVQDKETITRGRMAQK